MTLVRLLNYHLQSSRLKKEHQIHRQILRVSEFKFAPSRIIDVIFPSKHLEKFSRRFTNDDTGPGIQGETFTFLRELLPVYLCYDSVSLKFHLVVCKAWTLVIFELTEIQMKNYSASCRELPWTIFETLIIVSRTPDRYKRAWNWIDVYPHGGTRKMKIRRGKRKRSCVREKSPWSKFRLHGGAGWMRPHFDTHNSPI